MTPEFWVYPAEVLEVIDGDTVDVLLDLGFDMRHRIRVRVAGIDTPETRNYKKHRAPQSEAGRAVRDLLRSKLQRCDLVWVRSTSYGKYAGRIVGELWFRSNGDEVSVADYLVEHGLAHEYAGGKRRGWTKAQLQRIVKTAAELGEDSAAEFGEDSAAELGEDSAAEFGEDTAAELSEP